MKKFIRQLSLFMAVWFISTAAIDYIYTNQLHKQNIREVVIWDDILNDRVGSDIVILGSSRAADHYQPRIIDSILNVKSYNLGQYGKKADADIMRYEIVKRYSTTLPRCIIWDLYYGSLDYSTEYYDEQYTPFLFNEDIWKGVNRKHRHFTLLDKYVPILRYWKKGIFPHYEALQNPYRGFVYNVDYWNPTNMLKLRNDPISYIVDSEIVDEIDLTIKDMQQHNIDVILVYSPFYSDGQDCVNGFDSSVSIIKDIAVANRCVFLDYTEDPMCSDSSIFKNAQHLSPNGTDFFSSKFAWRLDSIFKASNPPLY